MYDLAIIGGGPAGYTAAEKAAKAGWQVLLFEQTALGGTCLNVGCIPTKTLLYGAKTYHNMLNAAKYGVTAQQVGFDYARMQQRKNKVVRKLAAGIRARLQGCTIVSAQAQVEQYEEGRIAMTANGEHYEAQRLLICTGSVNFVPPIAGVLANPYVWDSTAALAATELPASVVIVGGGVIGMEFATLYNELGVDVTVIEAMPTVLANTDADIVAVLRTNYEKKGVRFLTQTKVTSIEGQEVHYEQQAENEEVVKGTVCAERILVSVGRRANLEGLDKLPLEIERGAIRVDEFMQTNLKGVYAAGDVTGKIMLAHVASRQAEVAVGRMLKQIPLQRIAYNAIPSVVYTNPEIAVVGLSESDLTGKDCVLPIPYDVHSLPMTYSGRFVAENEGETGLCKLITDKKSNTVLGVHMVGNPCSEFVAAASFAVRMGYTLAEFQQVVFPHPTVSEIMRECVVE